MEDENLREQIRMKNINDFRESFPDDFVFTGTRTQQYRQVGNAVPPLLGYHLGLKILDIISKKEDSNG